MSENESDPVKGNKSAVSVKPEKKAGKPWKPWVRYGVPVICILAGVFLMLYPPQRIAKLDSIADQYFEDSVLKASVAYGSARLINAGVSVVKESSLQLEPAGVGLSVAVGQVADPLDDLTERLSSVLVTAIVSLLVQKISYEIAQAFVFVIIGGTLVLAGFLSFFNQGVLLSYRNLLIKVGLFLFVVRLFLPCSALISNHLNEELFFPRIEEHQTKLEPMLQDFKELTRFETPEIKGIGDVFTSPVRMMNEKTMQLNFALTLLVANGLEIFNQLIAIMALYLGIFVIQVLFLPVAMFWLLNKLLFILFSYTMPTQWRLAPVVVEKEGRVAIKE